MSPSKLERLVIHSASWMFKREKSKDFWWNPGVLTRENPDKSNPGLSRDDAEKVFEELRKRQLLENRLISDQNINSGEPFLVYKINENKKKEWIEIIEEKGTWNLFVIPWARHLFGVSFPLLKGIGYAIILAFFVKFAEKFADYIWNEPMEITILEDTRGR